MRLSSFKILFFLIPFFLISFGLPKNVEKKVNKELVKFLDTKMYAKEYLELPTTITAQLPKSIAKGTFFKVFKNKELVNYLYVGNAPSHVSTFDYLVLFDLNSKIVHTKVLIYRESYGYEITSKRWLSQFLGKSIEDTLSYSQNIDAISGATISGRSMTRVLDDLLKSFKILQDNNAL